MNLVLQQIGAVTIVALAGAYVLWTVISQLRTRSSKACGSSCSGCGSSDKSLGESKPFVGIDALSQPPRQ